MEDMVPANRAQEHVLQAKRFVFCPFYETLAFSDPRQ